MINLIQTFHDDLKIFFDKNGYSNDDPTLSKRISESFNVFVRKRVFDGTENNEERNTEFSTLIDKLKSEGCLWILPIAEASISPRSPGSGLVNISLRKQLSTNQIVRSVIQCGDSYGKSSNSSLLEKEFYLSGIQDPPSDLTKMRIHLAKEMLKEALLSAGAKVLETPNNSCTYVSLGKYGEKLEIVSNASLKVNIASVLRSSDVSPTDYFRKRNERLKTFRKCSNDIHCIGDTNLSDEDWDVLVDASVKFDLFITKLSKTVVVREEKESSRDAVYVMYNFVRLKVIEETFNDKNKIGVYSNLPELSEVDFSLLDDEEWRLVFNFLLVWPQVLLDILECDEESKVGEFKIHLIFSFLKEFAHLISSYYASTQILREGRAHLMPLIHARIYLVKAILQVLSNGFKILGIKPLEHM